MTDVFSALQQTDKRPSVADFTGHFEPIIPFDQLQTPEIPPGLLPPVIGNFVQNVSEVLQIPPAMPVMTALGILSAALSKKFVVSPKPDWQEPVNIYTLTAMLPASNKSQTLKYLKRPIDLWEERESERIGPQRDKALVDIKLLQAELNKQTSILTSKKSSAGDVEKAREAIRGLETTLKEQQAALPVLPQVYTTDATPEAIAELVHGQNGRLGIISDEGGILEVLAGLYNNGNANVDIFLKGIDGGATRIKRANRDFRLNPFLSIILLVQPQILSNMAEKRSFTGNGALERFLYALPVGTVGYRRFAQTPIDELAESSYGNRLFNLLSLPVPEEPHTLTLEAPAGRAFESFWAEIERDLRPDGKLRICMGWGGKLPGYTLRLAGLMHIAEHESPAHSVIQRETMEKAIQLARLLIDHAVAAYGLMGTDQETKDAQELLEWLKTQRHKDRLTKTEIIDAMHSRRMGKKNRLAKALEVLVERNMLSSPHEDRETKKPTEIYFINPKIHRE